MPYLQLDGQQHVLASGDNPIGAGAAVRVVIAGSGVEGVYAVVQVGADGGVVIRRMNQPVRVNGVQLGAEPAPLLHGDKIEIAGRELIFGEDRRAGSTQYVSPIAAPSGVSSRTPTPPQAVGRMATPVRASTATGGRLISLVDGREYVVPTSGLVIGRDPTCDVVVPSTEVSRKHALVSASDEGYVLTDTSTNGVQVNGERVRNQRGLARGDLIRIADEEFRFYADPTAAARQVLAILEVMSGGLLKGRRFEVRSPLTHIGRGAHNDVVLPDESVSDSHAKLQRRESGWVIVDMDSTNGTYVGGRRIAGEQALIGTPDVRFGGIKLIFRGTEGTAPSAGGEAAAGAPATRVIASLKGAPRADAPTPVATRSAAEEPNESSMLQQVGGWRGPSTIVWVVSVLALVIGVLLLLTSR
ncbi:MAG TPA: FHA domain-containing protein [Gemmatimonadaceae bacterium]|nr:FHA domain-containing protein [Gemmatimonadaceae bacterium]